MRRGPGSRRCDIEMRVRRALPDLPEERARDLVEALDRLITALLPERIYLFGSYARGTATSDSDVDLLVVVASSDLPPHRRDQDAYRAITGHAFPMDVLVITSQEFEQQRHGISSLPAVVLREGSVLYAA